MHWCNSETIFAMYECTCMRYTFAGCKCKTCDTIRWVSSNKNDCERAERLDQFNVIWTSNWKFQIGMSILPAIRNSQSLIGYSSVHVKVTHFHTRSSCLFLPSKRSHHDDRNQEINRVVKMHVHIVANVYDGLRGSSQQDTLRPESKLSLEESTDDIDVCRNIMGSLQQWYNLQDSSPFRKRCTERCYCFTLIAICVLDPSLVWNDTELSS